MMRAECSHDYKPYGKTRAILDRAMEHLQSVEYKVSARWLFYRLLQEGFYSAKDDYDKFILLTSRARKNWYGGWRPDTLADETRAMVINQDTGERPGPDIHFLIESGVQEALEEIDFYRDQAENYEYECSYAIDPNYYRDYFCIVMFEARAMRQQFQKYTEGLTLCPFGGQPSIPFKWEIAKFIEAQCAKYGKPCMVLYFGDSDDAGLKIFTTARDEVSQWCNTEIEFIRCGLTEEQALKYEIPENPEHPGSYQWEALTDPQAREIIQEGLHGYYDYDLKARAWDEAQQIRETVSDAVNQRIADA